MSPAIGRLKIFKDKNDIQDAKKICQNRQVNHMGSSRKSVGHFRSL
jgi:hypothetical protein